MYQTHNDLLGVPIFSERIAIFSFLALLSGIIFLCTSFYKFSIGSFCQAGAILTLTSFILFAINFHMATRNPATNTVEIEIISSSIVWLLATGLIGVLLVFNFTYAFIPKPHLDMLAIHAHFGFAGWIVLLTLGVASKLLPNILSSKNVNGIFIKLSNIAINTGLIILLISIYWELPIVYRIISAGVIASGILFFCYFIIKVFINRTRNNFNKAEKPTVISFMFLLIALPIGILLSTEILSPETRVVISVIYGLIFIFGFSGTLILSHTLKIIPNLILKIRYQNLNEQTKDPFTKYPILKETSITMILFIGAVFTLCISFIIKWNWGIKISASLLTCAAALYNYTILRAIFYKMK
jgi:hypothetical protein